MKNRNLLYVVAANDSVGTLTMDKTYKVLTRFDTDLCGSGHCIVVNNDKNDIVGYDCTHFK